MIVPFAAGGPADTVGRIVAQQMRPIVVENVTGATGRLGVERALRAQADGYTLITGTLTTHVLIGALYALQYDLLRDFKSVALLADGPLLIVTRKTMAANNLNELMAWLKANPDKGSQGIAGFGAVEHIAGILLQKQTGIQFQQVPYRGNAPAMQDLLAGQIDMMFVDAATALPHVSAGRIKPYAVMGKRRLPAAPDIPTVDEAGLPGLYASLWYGLWAPARTSQDVITMLSVAVTEALAEPAVRQRLADLGQQIVARDQQTPDALSAFQKAEIDKWWPLIKAANIKGE
jgi:tripartite-type tricarboxylate transporter receptor subunit TctC